MSYVWADLDSCMKYEIMTGVLLAAYTDAEEIVNQDKDNDLFKRGVHKDIVEEALSLGSIKHASRGAALTLLAYKCCDPTQDIRAHKAEHEGGIAARTFDTKVTVSFLAEKSLPRSSESHWMSQSLSFAGPFKSGSNVNTRPQNVGPLLVSVINHAHSCKGKVHANVLLVALFVSLIEFRNMQSVDLTLPKTLPISGVRNLLNQHFQFKYKHNAPRLPQIAVYAIYLCILKSVERYSDQELEKLQRMKAADRKTGTVGDVVVSRRGNPVEAVEVKFGRPISYTHVVEAIEKVRSESVSRYYILSTSGLSNADKVQIEKKIIEFRLKNGCEIIVNGVVETICYYLRILPDTTEFLQNYTNLMNDDDDVDYEHRNAWNEICKTI